MAGVKRSVGLTFSVAVALLIGAPPAISAAAPSLPSSSADAMDVPLDIGPGQATRSVATAYAHAHPGSAPAGSNDFGCVPSAAHPRPVVLAHGTDTEAYADWAALSPALAADGYCVFALNYGGVIKEQDGDVAHETYGVGDIVGSATAFGSFVDQVLTATGADKVDVIGYSQGATVTRYYVNKMGGDAYVDHWVGLASPTYGGVMFGLVPIVRAIPGGEDFVEDVFSRAVREQMQGSDMLNALNDGGDTVTGVRYTTIGSTVDEMIQPSSNIALRDAGAENIVLQDLCPSNLTGHFRMPYDPYVIDVIRTVLDPDAERHATCSAVPLGTDIPQVVIDANS